MLLVGQCAFLWDIKKIYQKKFRVIYQILLKGPNVRSICLSKWLKQCMNKEEGSRKYGLLKWLSEVCISNYTYTVCAKV